MCTGSATNCDQCIGSNRGPIPDCACNDGFYDNGNTCEACDSSLCATCSGSPTSCVIECPSSCKTCSSNGDCTSCLQN